MRLHHCQIQTLCGYPHIHFRGIRGIKNTQRKECSQKNSNPVNHQAYLFDSLSLIMSKAINGAQGCI